MSAPYRPCAPAREDGTNRDRPTPAGPPQACRTRLPLQPDIPRCAPARRTGDQRHQPAQDRGAVEAADDGAVAGNEDDRQIELLGNRACEREAAAGDEGDLDAAIDAPAMARRFSGGTFPLRSRRVPSMSMARRRMADK